MYQQRGIKVNDPGNLSSPSLSKQSLLRSYLFCAYPHPTTTHIPFINTEKEEFISGSLHSVDRVTQQSKLDEKPNV